MSGLKRCCVGQEQSRLCHKRNSCYWYWQSLQRLEDSQEDPTEGKTNFLLEYAACLAETGGVVDKRKEKTHCKSSGMEGRIALLTMKLLK